MKNNDILRLAASACVMLCLPLHVFGQGMGVAWDVLTKDDTPEYLDADDRWFGVDKPTSFRLALRYYGITSVRPASLSYPLPVDDNSISASVKMMRYDSSDGDFQFWLSAPSRDSEDPGYMPFHDEMPAQRLYYDWNDRGRYLTLKPDTSVSLQPAYGHRLFMKADNAGDVLTWHVSHARTMFNADTVCLYDMPRKRFEGMRNANRVDSRFTHCKVMIIHKHDRCFMYAYCLFTDKGLSKANRYIGSLKDIVRFDDNYVPTWKIPGVKQAERRLKYHKEKLATVGIEFAIPCGYMYCHEGSVMLGGAGKTLFPLSAGDVDGICMESLDARDMIYFTWRFKPKDASDNRNDLTYYNYLRVPFARWCTIPESFIEKIDLSLPDRNGFKAIDDISVRKAFNSDTIRVFAGKTSDQKRFVFRSLHEDGDMYLELMDDDFPEMEIWEIEKNGIQVRMYRFMKSASGTEVLPQVMWFI